MRGDAGRLTLPARMARTECHTRQDARQRRRRYAGPYAKPNVAGIALPGQGIIAVKAPRLMPQGFDFNGTIRHELIHVLLARNVPAGRLPHRARFATVPLPHSFHDAALLRSKRDVPLAPADRPEISRASHLSKSRSANAIQVATR